MEARSDTDMQVVRCTPISLLPPRTAEDEQLYEVRRPTLKLQLSKLINFGVNSARMLRVH